MKTPIESKKVTTEKQSEITLGIKRFELMIKLLLFKYAYETNTYLRNGNNSCAKFNTIDQIFKMIDPETKKLFSKSFLKACKRIAAINIEINKSSNRLNEFKNELVKILGIDPVFVTFYEYDEESPNEKILQGERRLLLLFTYAQAVAKFNPKKDILQTIDFVFENECYSISPMSVAHDLNCPPLTEEVHALQNHCRAVYDFEIAFSNLVWKFGELMKTECSNPINLHNAKPNSVFLVDKTNSISYEHNLDSSHINKNQQTDQKSITNFFLQQFVPLLPYFTINKNKANPTMDRLNKLVCFASSEELYNDLHQNLLDSDTVKNYGEILLKTACFHNNIKLIKKLLQMKVNPFENILVEIPTLCCVAMSGSIGLFDLLAPEGGVISASTYLDYSVHDTAMLSEKYALALHIEQKFPYKKYISSIGEYDILCMAMASRNMHAIITLLTIHRIVPTLQHLWMALQLGQLKTFDLFIAKTPIENFNPEILNHIVGNNLLKQADLIFRKKVNLNGHTKKGYSLLSIAISQALPSMTELLLQYGADPNILDITGAAPLIRATVIGSKRIVQALINANASIHVRYQDKSILEIAVINQYQGLVQFLISNLYFSPNDMTFDNITVFEFIIRNFPKFSLVQACLNHSDVKLTATDGTSLLELALSEQCHAPIIEILAQAHMKVTAQLPTNLQELIAQHPENEKIAQLFNTKSIIAENSAQLSVALNPFLLLCRDQNIPKKDWHPLAKRQDDPNSCISFYQSQRKHLIAELLNLYGTLTKKFPEEALKLDLNKIIKSAPIRSLQTKIARIRDIITIDLKNDFVVENIGTSRSPHPIIKEESTYFGGKITYTQLIPILGLVAPLNNSRYALVTNQLDTLIHDFTEDRLEPFKRVLATPMISNKNGLKDIKARHATVTIKIDGEELKLNVSHYLKARTKDRILVAEITPHNGSITLLVPVKWLRNGFHDDRYNGITHFSGGHAVTTDLNCQSSPGNIDVNHRPNI